MKTVVSSVRSIGFCAAFASAFAGQSFAQTATAPSAAVRVPTIAQLAQFPAMTGFQISPDGKHMLAIESAGDVRNIVI